MEGTDTTRHPPAEEIADYFGGRLPSRREAELDIHFGSCDTCATAAQHIRMLSYIVARWSAVEHRRAAEEAMVVRALERARVAPACAQWSDRLSRWAERWAGKSEAALRVAFRRAGESVEASISGLADLTRSGALWPEFVPQVAMATRGVAEASAVVSTSEDAPRIRVAALDEGGKIEVDIEAVPSGPAPLVMLVPHDPTGRLLLGELRPSALPAHFVAVFEGIGVGEYTLVIEPLATSELPSTGNSFG